MDRDIKKKQIILENRRPFTPEVRTRMQEMDLIDWITASMRLDGSPMGREQIEIILNGGFIEEFSLVEHVLVTRYNSLVAYARDLLEMTSTLNIEMLFAFQKKLSEEETPGFRRGNPVLIALDYNPPHPAEIKEQLSILIDWFYSDDEMFNPVKKAALLHHRVIEIYPFDEYSEAVARACMYYHLMQHGLPVCDIELSQQEYYAAIIAYLKKANVEPFYRSIERSMHKKMESLIELTQKSR